jgi:YfiH family protein
MILPTPNQSFEWVQTTPGPALVCRPLEALAAHLFTTRHWPLGSTPTGSGDDVAWDDVARAMAVDIPQLVRVHQVHGAGVAIGPNASQSRPTADIIVANDPALALAIQAADCVPLLIADRRSGAVAAAHAGWRGIAARVPALAVDALAREFGSRRSELVAAVGPSIGACCYEVGIEVRDRFAQAGFTPDQLGRWFLSAPTRSARNPSMPGLLGRRRAERWFFDAWKVTRDQLVASGVSIDQVFVAQLCTASHPDALCSYRRDGPPGGRIAGAIRCGPRHPSRRSPADLRAR